MAHPSDIPPSHFSASHPNTPAAHQDLRHGPPPNWQGPTYAAVTAQSPAPFQTPLANPSYATQGYRGHDGRGPDRPVNPAEQYQFSLRPVAIANSQSIPIDPALLRDDHEHAAFAHPRHRVEHDHHSRSKKQDVRAKASRKPKKSKGKGKGRALSSDSESDDDARGKTRPGRGGAPNYSNADKDALFNAVEAILPTGEKGWKAVEEVYNEAVLSLGRPERVATSLKAKYQSYTKQKKPTGQGECPPEVKRAHEIEDLINTKAGTRDVDDDSDLADDDDDDSDVPKVVEPVRSAVARRAPSPTLRRPRASAGDAVTRIVRSLDPATLRDRDDARAHHSFERTQLMTLSAQVDALRRDLTAAQQENNDLKRERDRADMERTWAARFDQAIHGRSRRYDRSRSPTRHRRRGRGRGRTTLEERDGLQRVGGKVRIEHQYSDGGVATLWQTDASSDATDFDHRPQKKQRRRSPTPYERRTPTPSPPRRPISRRRTPTPGPSRLPFTSNPTSDTLVSGNSVELVVTPRRGGAPLGLIISPTVQRD